MTTMSITRVVVTFAAAALLAGCQGNGSQGNSSGGSPQPSAPTTPADNGVAALQAGEILDRARTALTQAKSYRIKGTFLDKDGRTTLDFKVSGDDVGGWISVDKARVEVLSIDGQQYMRPNEAFWASLGDRKKARNFAKLMGDKWAKLPAKNKDFADLFDVANVDELLKPGGTLTKGAAKDVDGVRTIALLDDGPKGGTMYVATVGQPYPIRVDGREGTDDRVTFSDFGATFADIKAPPETQVIDFEQLARN